MVKFFLPNFEDLVDPDFDFIHDLNSPERIDRYTHDRYPHEFFDESIFDGMLLSKTIVKPRTEKRIRDAGGLHRFLRLDETYPIMGDCGAFSFVNDIEPPYSTEEILNYYESLGFTYGVSIDHVIFGSFPLAERTRRWELTLDNAARFLDLHQKGHYTFTPVGIAQGDSPYRYAEAVERLIEMGYKYMALGGLARSPDKQIREVLRVLNLPKGVDMHLFGVARYSMIPDFIRYGVTSVDSASPMRKAFLGNGEDNYWMADGNHYSAIRVPETNPKQRKRGVQNPDEVINGDAPVSSYEELKELEQSALKLLRRFDIGEAEFEDTLSAVLLYHRLFGQKKDHEEWYRRVLTDRPWQTCRCPICESVGVEVIIFRGNNRNRRRGFHNCRVFFKQFKKEVARAHLLTDHSDDTVQMQFPLD